MNKVENFRVWNEAMVKKYNPESYIFRSNFLVRSLELRRFRKINELLQLTHNDDLLDIGCGTCEDAIHLARRGISVMACDLSAGMLNRADEQMVGTLLLPPRQGYTPKGQVIAF